MSTKGWELQVPDEHATLPYFEYRGARRSDWPIADFIVGNPPYVGNKRMREALGDGSVEALRAAYGNEFESTDLVMFWWARAAEAVASGSASRAGLITTNTISQRDNRKIVQSWSEREVHVVWAIADHPWIAEADGAAVRVALTVIAFQTPQSLLLRVDEVGQIASSKAGSTLNADLTMHADVSRLAASPLLSNQGVSFRGVSIVGDGFVLDASRAAELSKLHDPMRKIIRPLLAGRDLVDRPRGFHVIDFGLMDEPDAAEFAGLYDILRSTVKPVRAGQKRAAYVKYWWRFAEPRRELREAIMGLSRYVATVQTSQHRFFVMVDSSVVAEQMLVVIATESWFMFGVMSSRIHVVFAEASGGTLEDRPRYANSVVFNPYPFPFEYGEVAERIARLAQKLDSHRAAAISRDSRVTMTGMYNIIEKLRDGVALTPKEKTVHELAACGVLKDLHDELDQLVADAYGWPRPMQREEILERLVALHDERVAEEKAGKIRWLRPDYQIPRFAPESAPDELALPTPARGASAATVLPKRTPWPVKSVEQLGAVKAAALRVGPDPTAVLAAFSGADEKMLRRHLETLNMMGELV